MMQGIYQGIPSTDYHALTDYVSNSYLSRLDKCPKAAKVPMKETDALVHGGALHSLLLEGMDAFNKEYLVPPYKLDLRKNADKEFAADVTAAGLTLISEDVFGRMKNVVEAVYSHPTASVLMREGLSEQTVFWTDPETGLPCKCRPDRIPKGDKGVIIDFKKARDAGYEAFTNACARYKYYIQSALYLDGYNVASGKKADAFVFIVAELEEPFRVEVYSMSDDFVEVGRQEVKRLLQIEKVCREGGYWPHFSTSDIREIYCPSWIR
jgi:exodeoxyribonuclease VIII